jgi:hypothetical protein
MSTTACTKEFRFSRNIPLIFCPGFSRAKSGASFLKLKPKRVIRSCVAITITRTARPPAASGSRPRIIASWARSTSWRPLSWPAAARRKRPSIISATRRHQSPKKAEMSAADRRNWSAPTRWREVMNCPSRRAFWIRRGVAFSVLWPWFAKRDGP